MPATKPTATAPARRLMVELPWPPELRRPELPRRGCAMGSTQSEFMAAQALYPEMQIEDVEVGRLGRNPTLILTLAADVDRRARRSVP